MNDTIARAIATSTAKRTGLFLFNTDIGLRRWRAALAKLRAGALTYVDVPFIGDSITEGRATGAGANEWPSKGYVGRLRTMLQAEFGDAGMGMIPTFHPSGAPLWTFSGTGWSDNAAWGIMSLAKSTKTNGDTATINFNGTGIVIVAARASSHGTFTASIDGGAATTYNTQNATPDYAYAVSITGLSDGSHTLTLTKTSDAAWFVLIGAYEIKGSGVRLHQAARSGQGVAQATVAWSLSPSIDAYQPPLTVISLLANDFAGQTNPATYRTGLQTLITRAQQYGDVLLTTIGIKNEAHTIPQTTYVQIVRELALQNGCAYFDAFTRWGGDGNYAQNTLGLMADNVHPNDAGHFDLASALYRILVED